MATPMLALIALHRLIGPCIIPRTRSRADEIGRMDRSH